MELNVDSLLVVKALEEGKIGNVECTSILKRVKDIIGKDEVVIVSHVNRESNWCADKLAKHGCMITNFISYDEALYFV